MHGKCVVYCTYFAFSINQMRAQEYVSKRQCREFEDRVAAVILTGCLSRRKHLIDLKEIKIKNLSGD